MIGFRSFTPRGVCLHALLFAGALAASAAETAGAEARIGAEVINGEAGPFTATISAVGAGVDLSPFDGGFEPIVLRLAFVATGGGGDMAEGAPFDLSIRHSLRSGALEGAEVHVYRMTDGAMRRVRAGRVAAGGHVAESWRPLVAEAAMLPPDAAGFPLPVESGRRPGSTRWLAVVAIGEDGSASDPSEAVAVMEPAAKRGGPAAATPETIPRPRSPRAGAGPRPPQDLAVRSTAGGDRLLTWARTPGAAGYAVLEAEAPPDQLRGAWIRLEPDPGTEQVRPGDLVRLSKRFTAPTRALFTDRAWGAHRFTQILSQRLLDFWPGDDPARDWRLAPHDPDTPVTAAGETYLAMRLDRGATARIGRVNHAGSDQDWYPILEARPYAASAWLRADRPTTVWLRFIGPYAGAIRPVAFEAGPQWRRFEAIVTPPRVLADRRPGLIALEAKGPVALDVDNFDIRPADAPYLTLTAEDRAALAASGMAALRTHGFVKTGHNTYDLASFTNEGGAVTGVRGRNTLPQTLAIMADLGVDPWLQVEPHFSPEEFAGLIEYLAAPFDPARDDPAERPWAAKRAAQGRVAPWTDAFDRIILELGNETWNRGMHPWIFPPLRDAATGRDVSAGTVYGAATQLMIDTMRASPWWRAAGLDDKVVFTLGGWARNPNFGRDAALAAPGASWLTVAAYNGGWDENEGPPARTPASYFSVLNQISYVAGGVREQAELARRLAAARGAPLAHGTYEAGPGYAMDGLNRRRVTAEQAREQEEVMKSQAAAAATLDSFLFRAAAGFVTQNFFTFGRGPRWTSHAVPARGGEAYAPWRLLTLWNRVGAGDMLKTSLRDAPRMDLPAGFDRAETPDAPLVAVYAARRDDRLTVALISRRVPGWPDPDDAGWTPMTLRLPIVSARSLTLHRMTGAYDAHDVDGRQVAIEQVALPVPPLDGPVRVDAALGADDRGLKAASVLIYVFEGVRFAN